METGWPRKWDCPARAGGAGLSERRLRLLYLGFLLAAAAALPLDCGLSQWCLDGNLPRFLHDPLDIFAVFGHGLMAAVVLVAIYQLDPPRRRALWWVLACVALSGLAANGGKMLVARIDPHDFDFHGGVWATFGQWLPATGMWQSFPSGHAATAAGLALALAAVYPEGAGCSCCWRCWSAVSGSSAAPTFSATCSRVRQPVAWWWPAACGCGVVFKYPLGERDMIHRAPVCRFRHWSWPFCSGIVRWPRRRRRRRRDETGAF